MSYKTDSDFDFYSELNNSIVTEEPENAKNCMISHLPLTYNSIVLPCNHAFNYLSLYTELCANRSNDYKIHCPYCRATSTKLLPYIPLPNVVRVIGVNHPPKVCMPALACGVVLKKGSVCQHTGVETAEGIFCLKHLAKKPTSAKDEALNSKTVVELRSLLREKGLKVGGLKSELVKRLSNTLLI